MLVLVENARAEVERIARNVGLGNGVVGLVALHLDNSGTTEFFVDQAHLNTAT